LSILMLGKRGFTGDSPYFLSALLEKYWLVPPSSAIYLIASYRSLWMRAQVASKRLSESTSRPSPPPPPVVFAQRMANILQEFVFLNKSRMENPCTNASAFLRQFCKYPVPTALVPPPLKHFIFGSVDTTPDHFQFLAYRSVIWLALLPYLPRPFPFYIKTFGLFRLKGPPCILTCA